MIKVRFDTSNNSIIVMIDTLYTNAETRLTAHPASIFTTIIEQITEINDRTVADIMETKVSSTTFFSSSFLLSSFPTIIAANPNKTVKTKEKTVVNIPLNVSSIQIPSPYTKISAKQIGNTIKQSISHTEILLVRAFLNT